MTLKNKNSKEKTVKSMTLIFPNSLIYYYPPEKLIDTVKNVILFKKLKNFSCNTFFYTHNGLATLTEPHYICIFFYLFQFNLKVANMLYHSFPYKISFNF